MLGCGPIGAALGAAAGTMADRDGSFVPHDAVAAIAMLEPALFSWGARHVRCEADGVLTTGATVVDRRVNAPAPNALVAESVQSELVVKRILSCFR